MEFKILITNKVINACLADLIYNFVQIEACSD